MQLSEQQKEAMTTVNGQVILISCPGSGKTTTVVRRVQYMVGQGIPADQILVLTFSKAAALEMAERFYKLAGNTEMAAGVTFATIHSFCYSVIAPEYQLNVRNILGAESQWMIIRKGVEYLKRNEELSMEIRDYVEFTNSCLREISVINNNGCDWNTYQAETCPTEEFHKIYNLYEQSKQESGKIDYDDMLKLCYQLFCDQPEVLEAYRQRFKYLIVDEYQDTNFLQRDILYMLAGDPRTANICVVGDDDQSIYKFRGARPEVMLGFSRQYPGCKEINMDVNYRSCTSIIHYAKRLIEHNQQRFPKDIKPFRTSEGVIKHFGCKNTNMELNQVARNLKAMHENLPYEEMAVLYRNNNQAVLLSAALSRKGIPFHSDDKLSSPYKHWIFADMMAYYRLASGTGDWKDLIQVINHPNRFIPENALRNCPPDRLAVLNCIQDAPMEPWKKKKAMAQVRDFFMNLQLMDRSDPKTFIEMVCTMGGYNLYLANYAKYRNMDVSELTGLIDSYKDDIQTNNILDMDEWMLFARRTNQRIDEINRQNTKKGVTISTMHKSKGREWPAVFLIGANEGIVPGKNVKKSADIEEERRLFYVAATRAKDILYISYVESDYTEKSRFVTEMFGEKQYSNASSPEKREKLRNGMRVWHKTFGKGTVVQAIPDAVAVKFDKTVTIRKFVNAQQSQLSVLKN